MHAIPHRRFAALAVAVVLSSAMPSLAAAEDPLWTAVIAIDEDGLGASGVRVITESAGDCAAELAFYRDAVVIEPCQPVIGPSAITDDNDYPRHTRTPRPKDDGKGAGAGGGLGGLGQLGGG